MRTWPMWFGASWAVIGRPLGKKLEETRALATAPSAETLALREREFVQAAHRLALAQKRSKVGELFAHTFDTAVERHPWLGGSGANNHNTSDR